MRSANKSVKAIVSCGISAVLIPMLGLFGCTTSADTGSVDASTQPAQTAFVADDMADRTITDASGRTVTVPGTGVLERIYYTGATGEIFCYTLAPDLAGGTTYEFTPQELELLRPEAADLKYLGTTSGGKELNLESIMEADIQLIVSVATDVPTEADRTSADDLQTQTGIPVVVFSGAFDDISATYRALGSLLGYEEQAGVLAAYCEDKLAAVEAAVATVPQSQRVSLYYAEGPDGLQTEPETSAHALVYKLAGAMNVAQVEAAGGKGMSNVSLEQVMAWDPQVIIAWDDVVRGGADELIRTDPAWANIRAVRDGRVYTMPNVPFSWCDRPPAVNRFLGIQWVANMLYPHAYDIDIVQVTREFYSLFYHVDITDARAREFVTNPGQ